MALTERLALLVDARVDGAVRDIKTLAKESGRADDTAKKLEARGKAIGTAWRVGVGVAGGAALVKMVGLSADFGQAMSNVEAATHESAKGMADLRAAAIKAGADTSFSANEAAQAIEALAKANVETTDILNGGLSGALDLAAAGQIAVADAAEIAATAMNQFNLAGKDVPHVADLLAAASNKAMGEVTDLATSLKYVGPVAAQMGVSIEETTGTIAELAQAGILGDQAGTSLRGMLSSLTSPSALAAKEMKKLGINVYDAQGQFVGFRGVAGELQESMGRLSNAERDQALGRIFGNEQITTARILYAGGAAAVDKWTDAVNDQGYAAETAAIKMDNLKGDLEALKGSLDSAFIGSGSGTQGPLRELVQGTTALVNGFNALPGPIQAVAGGTAIAASGFVLLAPRVKATKDLLSDLGVTAPKAGRALNAFGKATGVVAGVVALDIALEQLNDTMTGSVTGGEKLKSQILDLQDGKIKALSGDFASLAQNIEDIGTGGLFKVFEGADSIPGISAALATFNNVMPGESQQEQFRELKDQLLALDDAMAGLVASGGPEQARAAFDALAASMNLSATGQEELLAGLPRYEDALVGASNATRQTDTATKTLVKTTEGFVTVTEEEADALQASIDAMKEKRSLALAAANAEIGYQAAIDDARAALKENGKTLDITTEKGRANKSALLDMAGAWNELSQREKNSKGARAEAIQQFVDMATKMGMGEQKARDLAKRLLEIPTKRVIDVEMNTESAKREFEGFVTSIAGRRVVVGLGTHVAGARADGGPVRQGEAYLVGERGMEVFVPDTNGRIVPNDALGRSSGGTPMARAGAADNSVMTYAKSLDKASKMTEKHAQTLLKSADEIRDGVAAKIRNLKQERAGIADSFASSFGQNVFGSEASSIEGILGLAGKQASDADALNKAVSALIGKGVSEGVLEDLLAGGQSGAAQIKLLAGADKAQLAEFNKLTQIADANLAAAGGKVGGALLNDDIKAAERDRRAVEKIADVLEEALDKRDKNTTVVVQIGEEQLLTVLRRIKRRNKGELGL